MRRPRPNGGAVAPKENTVHTYNVNIVVRVTVVAIETQQCPSTPVCVFVDLRRTVSDIKPLCVALEKQELVPSAL